MSAMAKILSVHPLGWESMKGHWWQFVRYPGPFRNHMHFYTSGTELLITL